MRDNESDIIREMKLDENLELQIQLQRRCNKTATQTNGNTYIQRTPVSNVRRYTCGCICATSVNTKSSRTSNPTPNVSLNAKIASVE